MNDTGPARPLTVAGTAQAPLGQGQRCAARIDANPALCLTVAALGLIVYLTLRNTGLNPVVMMDEWGYSMSARHLPPSEAIFPSYVYSALYRTTNRCGSAFLDCARFYNALFLAASLPFLYWVAKPYMERWAAVIVAVLAVFSPVSSYSLYFMPEPVYFFGFWVLTWIVLRAPRPSPIWHGAGAGLILGVMVHVKIHAVFLAAGLAAYAILGAISRGDRKAWRTAGLFLLALAVLFPLTWIALRTLLLSGSPTGPAAEQYTSIAATALDWRRALAYGPLAVKSFLRQVLALAFLFGLPLTVLLHHWRETLAGGQHSGNTRDLHLYLAVLLGLLTVVVALLTANVAYTSPYDVNTRVHLRYYSFVFPLLLIVAGAEAAGAHAPARSRWQWAPAAIVGAVALLAWFVIPHIYQAVIVDSPELYGILFPHYVFAGAALLTLLSIALWYLQRQWGAAFFLFCFFPVLILVADFQMGVVARSTYAQPSLYDTAGRFTRLYLGEETGRLTLVSSNVAEIYRAHFHVDHGKAQMLSLPPGAPVQRSRLLPDRTWVLVVGEHPLEFKTKQVIQRPGFVLAQIDPDAP